jgi:hypothetical protein
MIEDGDEIADIHYEYGENLYLKNTEEVYKAMLEASPTTDTVTSQVVAYEMLNYDNEEQAYSDYWQPSSKEIYDMQIKDSLEGRIKRKFRKLGVIVDSDTVTLSKDECDVIALNASRQIMKVLLDPNDKSNPTQLQAKIQVAIIDAIDQAKDE